MACYKLSSAYCSAPCKVCKQPALHNIGLDLFCDEHCPLCSPAASEWPEETETISGTQEPLF